LSGNLEDLAELDFCVMDMVKVVDLLEAAMEAIANDGNLMMAI
jgi:hypothetical protein